MPRKPREKSRFGIYHVILRGVNKQIIFEENEDYLQFIRRDWKLLLELIDGAVITIMQSHNLRL